MNATRTDWSDLPMAAQAFRVAHTAWVVVSMVSLADIWLSVATGRRDRRLAASIAWLSLEGIALVKERGDCPFGPLQTRLGDPVPLFELALPPRAAKAAVPVLSVISVVGIGLVASGPTGIEALADGVADGPSAGPTAGSGRPLVDAPEW